MTTTRLDELSLTDLMALNTTMGALASAGQLLAQAGLVPIFDLSPQWPMSLSVDFTMPGVQDNAVIDRALSVLWDPQFSAVEQTGAVQSSLDGTGAVDAGRDGGSSPSVAALAPAVVDAAGVRQLVVARDNTGDGGTVDHTVAVPPTETAGNLGDDDAESPDVAQGDGGTVADVRAVAAPVAADPPAAASNSAAEVKTAPDRWTEDEDAQALKVYEASLRAGMTKGDACLAVSKSLGRPILGVEYRFKHKLSDRAASIHLAMMREKQAAATKPVDAPMPSRPMPSKPGFTKAPPTPPLLDMAGHLASVPDTRGWDRTWDADLMQMACDGLEMNAIAADLGVDAGMVRSRFDALTGLYKDANDKTCRRFTREQARDHLAAQAKATAAA